MTSPASNRPTPAQVLLGLFVVGQLSFLPASNFVGLLLWAKPELAQESPPLRAVADVTGRWGEMTGQTQNWRLFAPDVPLKAVFVVVELRWNRDTLSPRVVRLSGHYEPADPNWYFHPPGSSDRLFHYENRLGWALAAWEREAVAQRPDEWRQYMVADIRRQWTAIRAYLRWRLAQFQREHPDQPPPDEMILLARIYPTPPPGQALDPATDMVDMPLARWRPREDAADGRLPIEPYDHMVRDFVPLPGER